MPLISVDLPAPLTPVTAKNVPSGKRTSKFLRLCSLAPLISSALPLPGRRCAGDRDLAFPRQIRAGERLGIFEHLRGRASRDDLAAELARARAEVDQVVGLHHRLFVVLDDDHRVADVAQRLQRLEQLAVVALMKADRRLVQNVDHARELGADLRGQADALALAAGERCGRAIQRQVAQADVDQEARAASRSPCAARRRSRRPRP